MLCRCVHSKFTLFRILTHCALPPTPFLQFLPFQQTHLSSNKQLIQPRCIIPSFLFSILLASYKQFSQKSHFPFFTAFPKIFLCYDLTLKEKIVDGKYLGKLKPNLSSPRLSAKQNFKLRRLGLTNQIINDLDSNLSKFER